MHHSHAFSNDALSLRPVHGPTIWHVERLCLIQILSASPASLETAPSERDSERKIETLAVNVGLNNCAVRFEWDEDYVTMSDMNALVFPLLIPKCYRKNH